MERRCWCKWRMAKIDNTTVLSGAGTGEYLAKWTDTETLGDSIVLTSG